MKRPRYITAVGQLVLAARCYHGPGHLWHLSQYEASGRYAGGHMACLTTEDMKRKRRAIFARHRKLARETAERAKRRKKESRP